MGKSHAAEALHRLSGRRGPLIVLDATTLAAADGLSGAFERARHGTLVLENLQRVTEAAAPRLTSALESATEVRIVSTSLEPPAALERRFPGDLLGRLSGFRCEIPPLRERMGDLGVVVSSLLLAACRTGVEIDVAAGRALLRHGWRGNIRELARTLDVATALSNGAPICVDHLPPELRSASS